MVSDYAQKSTSGLQHPECHLEARCSAITWPVVYVAAVVAGDLARQGQAEANTSIAGFMPAGGTVERLEDALAFPFWYAWPPVGDTETSSAC